MHTFLRKSFWFVDLAGIALLALVAAGVASDFIAGELAALPAARGSAPEAPVDRPGATGDLGRVARSDAAADALRTRRIFELDDPAPPIAVTSPGPAGPATPEPSDALAESQLPINLMGTFVSATPSFSYAALQIEGAANVASVGNAYLEGKAEVVENARGHIVLREDTTYTYVRLWADKTAQVAPRPRGPRGRNPPATFVGAGDNVPPAPAAANPNACVTKIGPYEYQLDRKMLDEQLADPTKLQTGARVAPHYRDNQYGGLELVDVRPGSLYRSIGIRSGDIITAVNGNTIDSPTEALELFEQLESASSIAVAIERRGQPRTLSYTIR